MLGRELVTGRWGELIVRLRMLRYGLALAGVLVIIGLCLVRPSLSIAVGVGLALGLLLGWTVKAVQLIRRRAVHSLPSASPEPSIRDGSGAIQRPVRTWLWITIGMVLVGLVLLSLSLLSTSSYDVQKSGPAEMPDLLPGYVADMAPPVPRPPTVAVSYNADASFEDNKWTVEAVTAIDNGRLSEAVAIAKQREYEWGREVVMLLEETPEGNELLSSLRHVSEGAEVLNKLLDPRRVRAGLRDLLVRPWSNDVIAPIRDTYWGEEVIRQIQSTWRPHCAGLSNERATQELSDAFASEGWVKEGDVPLRFRYLKVFEPQPARYPLATTDQRLSVLTPQGSTCIGLVAEEPQLEISAPPDTLIDTSPSSKIIDDGRRLLVLASLQTPNEIVVQVAHPFLRFKPAIHIVERAWSKVAIWLLGFIAGVGAEEMSLGLLRSMGRRVTQGRMGKLRLKLNRRLRA
jgi:hypothetical protein